MGHNMKTINMVFHQSEKRADTIRMKKAPSYLEWWGKFPSKSVCKLMTVNFIYQERKAETKAQNLLNDC